MIIAVDIDGDRRAGESLPVTDDERAEIARTIELIRAYGVLLDRERIRPHSQSR